MNRERNIGPVRMCMAVLCTLSMTMAAGTVRAQQAPKPAIRALTRATGRSIILRWAPTTPIAWQLGNENGYTVERYTVEKNGVDIAQDPEKITLGNGPYRPLPLTAWEAIVRDNDRAAIAAQAIYGDRFEMVDPSSNTTGFVDQSTELENRFSFALFMAEQSGKVAKASGLMLEDSDISPNEKYVYRVYLSVTNPDYPVDTATVFVDPNEVMELPAITDIKAEFGDRAVSLSWETFYFQRTYTAYQIEKSEDGGRTYSIGDGLPFLNTQREGNGPARRAYYVDSLASNDRTYHYRIRGITPFGEPGPVSEPVSGEGTESIAAIIPAIDSATIGPNGETYLKWRFPKDAEDKLKGFMVARARKVDGPYEIITKSPIAPVSRSFEDPAPQTVNYYTVRAMGKNGEEVNSFPALVQQEDNDPPSSPQGLSGEVDSLGNVTLKWSGNKEPDILGYKVFRGNGLDEEFVEVSNDILVLPTFRDKININTLTKKIYYNVVAMDQRFNTSDYSMVLKLERPDVVPPAAPVFTKVDNRASQVCLEWRPSPSKDVARYVLYREEADTLVKVAGVEVLEKVISFCDKEIATDRDYTYRLYAIDSTGNRSGASTIGVATLLGIDKSTIAIKASVDRDKRQVLLEWVPGEKEVDRVQLFRAANDGPLRLYRTMEGGTDSYMEKGLTVNTVYRYRIKVIYIDGTPSGLSKETKVVY